MRSTNLPFFRIDKKELLNLYLPNVPIIKEYKLNFTTDPIFSQSNIKSIYSMGINFLRNKLGSQDDQFIVTYQKTPQELAMIYIGNSYKKYGDHELKKYFYKEWNAVASYKLTEKSSSWKSNFNLSPAPYISPNFIDYKVDIYGLARRGNEWQGKRLILK
ncbi:hypothetical protein [Tenacibaculum maritimum]|uniref:hypothetical protein n=1 Tax=Tenacibaculum maritimum TaxID=107401 RepID=UPI001E36C4EA|nr:hypothetical protein [Tenacibaculum maritimum]MCD9610441.1 hypothetical protein [Tenacibaculum maritimum]